jgi:hypothetical protein
MARCSFPNCNSKAFARGLCVTHYTRQRRHGDAAATFKPGRPRLRPESPHRDDALRRDNEALRKECAALKRQLGQARSRATRSRTTIDMDQLTSDLARLKDRLALAEALLVANPGEVGELQRELEAARAAARNEAARARAAAKANPVTISRKDLKKLQAVVHPDSAPNQSAAQRTQALQILSGLKFDVTEE